MTLLSNNIGDLFLDFFKNTGIAGFFADGGWKNLIMILIALLLLYLAIFKKAEPYLLLPIAVGCLLANLPYVEIFKKISDGNGGYTYEGLLGVLYYGVKTGIYPCLIFLGIGATTDFGPLLSNPKTLILGAAAQIGIFLTFIIASLMGFTPQQAASIGIIAGADGPTAILTTKTLAPELLSSITIAAYSYMALVPFIQPPIIKLLTTKKERSIKMEELKPVSKTKKIIFPIMVMIVVILIVTSCAELIGCLMLGNLIKESGVVPKLVDAAANTILYTVTILLGLCVGATASADTFLTFDTLKIFLLGICAFALATASGVLIGKVMCVATKGKINPMIGAAGVSAVPMAARVVHKEGLKEDPTNFLLMHAMGPNVAGVIGSAVAAGLLIQILG